MTEWTTEPPKQEGWYWLLRGESPKIVRVTNQPKHGNQFWCEVKPEGFLPVLKIQNCLWAGPIPLPSEP